MCACVVCVVVDDENIRVAMRVCDEGGRAGCIPSTKKVRLDRDRAS